MRCRADTGRPSTPPRLAFRSKRGKSAEEISIRKRKCRSEEHTSELQSRLHLVCRLLLEKKKKNKANLTLSSNHTAHYRELPHHRGRNTRSHFTRRWILSRTQTTHAHDHRTRRTVSYRAT